MSSSEQENNLIRAAKSGDKQAFALLYQRNVQSVYQYIYMRVSDKELAEDITSDVFVRAYEKISSFERRGVPFLGWLYHIAQGQVIDHYRRKSRRKEPQSLDEVTLEANSNPEQIAFRNIRHENLLAHVDELTDEQQHVIMLRFLQSHSLEETATLMGKNVGAVKALQFRALRSLARLLNEASEGGKVDE
jgi:RNA polymerase sigma-70 factor (ECF subfamily)